MEEKSTDTIECHNDSANKTNKPNNIFTSSSAPASSSNFNKRKQLLSVSHNNETICDAFVTSEDIKKLKHVQGRSNSTGKLYLSARRVSFPENDSELVTGYLEPADPWASGN